MIPTSVPELLSYCGLIETVPVKSSFFLPPPLPPAPLKKSEVEQIFLKLFFIFFLFRFYCDSKSGKLKTIGLIFPLNNILLEKWSLE